MPHVSAGMHRVMEVDALRGLALLGILMVNVWFFADSSSLAGGPDPIGTTAVDIGIRFAVATLFEGKFYLLFSLLFGYGFAVLSATATENAVRLISRRLLFLAVLGILHGLTLFYGDILLTYALAGTILLATRTIAARTALGVAVAITAGVALLLVVSAALLLLDGTAGARSSAGVPITATASPAGALAANAGTYGVILPNVILFQGPLALAAFYAGSALVTLGVLRPAAPPSTVLRRVVVLTLPLGLGASAYQAYLGIWGEGDGLPLLATAISVAASPLVTVGYAASLLLLLGTRAGRAVAAVLAPTGRLSVSNYLAQSAVLCIVFTGYGFGLMDRLPAAMVVVVVVVLFAVQAGTSRLILMRYRTGPLEWALRRFVHRTPKRTSGHDGG